MTMFLLKLYQRGKIHNLWSSPPVNIEKLGNSRYKKMCGVGIPFGNVWRENLVNKENNQ